jgi:hypothetical protein
VGALKNTSEVRKENLAVLVGDKSMKSKANDGSGFRGFGCGFWFRDRWGDAGATRSRCQQCHGGTEES